VTTFWQRLRQRKLVQWAVAYVAAAFALLQGIDIVAQQFGWPESLQRGITLALVLGFFVVLVLAWYHGERGAQRVSGTEFLILSLLLAIGGGLLWKYAANAPASVAADSSAPVASTDSMAGAANPAPIVGKSIAVLPFENLSGDKDNAYFASGMQDMILTKLAAIGELKVISRTSTEKYASHPENLKTIAQQLGVASILEGSVQKSGSSVLINVQLIDAGSDVHLWAESYPRTLDNIFGVEGEVAQKVADALKAKLTVAETVSVASVPTRNPAAYELFLKAEYQYAQAWDSWQLASFLKADDYFRQAIALDPDFALAYAKLASCLLTRHWFTLELSDSEMSATKRAIDHALALAPDLPEAHLALGYYYYWGFRRYDEATVEFKRTLELAPNNVEAISGLGFVARRTGRVPQALSDFERVLSLSPRDPRANTSLGETNAMLRRYTEADRWLKRSLAIAPTDANALDQLLQTRLFGFGDLAGAREVFRQPPDWRISGQWRWAGDVLFLINPRAYVDFFDRRFTDALHEWDAAPANTDEERMTGRVARMVIKLVAGDRDSVKAECAELEPALAAELARQPDSLALLQQLSWVEVCLGRKADAIATAQTAVNVMPLSKDGYFGAYQLSGLAQIAAHADAPDQAIELIRQLLAIPAGTIMSIERLKLDPIWDPLRKDPRFQALLKKVAPLDNGAKAGTE
jgi:TolB-like protein/Tfp pilus assembly protein PilF